MDSLTGVLERIVFRHPDSHFTVARLRADVPQGRFGEALTTVVGPMPGVQIGETLRLEGQWATHHQHGREFRVLQCEPQLPGSVEGIRRYLGSGLIKGIGTKMAARIVERFGEDTLRVIEETPADLLGVAGISRKRVDMIAQAWTEQKEIKALMIFLQSHEVSTALASRIFRAYGAEALAVVRTDPYRMVKDVRGIGFRTADALAVRLGLPAQSIARHAAGLKHVLAQATDDGHVYLPREELLARGAELLACPLEPLTPALLKLVDEGEAIIDGEAVYLAPLFLAERHAARRLALLRGTGSLLFTQTGVMDGWLGEGQGAQLSPAQHEAVGLALRERLCIITGGPGVGKSTTVRGLVSMLSRCGIRFCLAAPTGRAAKRLSEATGQPAHTIHRLLQFSPSQGGFAVNEENPLPYQYVVADEASMLDIVLFYNLLKALGPAAHLLLVGDADQLPSVGPGNVLRDLVASGVVPTARLTELFRQARESRIVTAAHRINAGEVPDLANRSEGDLFFLREEDPDRAVATICDLVARRIPTRYGFSPAGDIQVISPMHRGTLGVARLNEQLQARLNPPLPGRAEIQAAGRTFRIGDRVMQVRNDYDRNVFNGDMGSIEEINPEEGTLSVAFPDGPATNVLYDRGNLDELAHAWAVSVHKAQGSEFPCVVLALLPQHHMLLQRNLVYTALTRARRLCVIVGSPRALVTALRTDRVAERYTALARRLVEETR